jgi:DNA modification methylase
MSHRVLHGDCLNIMRDMPTDSVDLVFCSPPYEDARSYDIDFKFRGQRWADWAAIRYLECCRVSRGLVAWVVNGRTKNYQWSCAPILLMADLHRLGVKLRKPPIFHRHGVAGSGGPDWLKDNYEFIICASDGKLPWSDNTAMGSPPKYPPGGQMTNRRPDGTREKQAYKPPAIANPGNVISLKVGKGHMGSDIAHENEAPFPESLAEFFVRSFCPPDGVVLDIFGGSGTTAAVAAKNGRNSVSVDVRASQIGLIERRILEVWENSLDELPWEE